MYQFSWPHQYPASEAPLNDSPVTCHWLRRVYLTGSVCLYHLVMLRSCRLKEIRCLVAWYYAQWFVVFYEKKFAKQRDEKYGLNNSNIVGSSKHVITYWCYVLLQNIKTILGKLSHRLQQWIIAQSGTSTEPIQWYRIFLV